MKNIGTKEMLKLKKMPEKTRLSFVDAMNKYKPEINMALGFVWHSSKTPPNKNGRYITIVNRRFKNPSITQYDHKRKNWHTFGNVKYWMYLPKFRKP